MPLAGGRQAQAQRARSRPISGSSVCRSGPCSSPVRARRSGRNSALALAAGRRLQRRRSRRPRWPRPRARAAGRRAAARRNAPSSGLRRRHHRAAHHLATSAAPRRAGRGCRAPPARTPRRRPPAAGRARSRSGAVQVAAVQREELLRVEARRGVRDRAEVEAPPRGRAACPGPGPARCRAPRGSPPAPPARSRRAGAGAATGCRGASTAARPRRPVSSGRCAKRSAAGSPPSASHRSICTPVLVTWSSPRTHVGDAALEVVHHGGEGVERRAVGADQHRVGQAAAASPALARARRRATRRCAATSRKRQWGSLPLARARSSCSGVIFSAARS